MYVITETLEYIKKFTNRNFRFYFDGYCWRRDISNARIYERKEEAENKCAQLSRALTENEITVISLLAAEHWEKLQKGNSYVGG
jgi:hypothetical protein